MNRRGRQRHGTGFLILVVSVLGACRIGGLRTADQLAHGAAGIRISVELTDGILYGELLEVRPEGLLVLVSSGQAPPSVTGPVVLLGPRAIEGEIRAGTDHPLGDVERGRRVTVVSSEERAWLSSLSRFPYGMGPELEGRLLGVYDQSAVEVVEGSTAVADTGRAAAFVREVERATRPYRDRELAIRHGYRRVGPDFPGMGEHWVNPGRVLSGGVDPARPQILTYVEVDEGARLTGAAFAMPLAAGEEPPSEPVGRDAWHDHGGSIDEESLVLESPHSMHGGTAGPRLAIFHTWLWPENPSGPLAQNNWALPFSRLGLDPPEPLADPVVARALSLAGDGELYYRTLLIRLAGIERMGDPEGRMLELAVGRAAERVRRVVEGRADLSRLSRAEVAQLESAWSTLWVELDVGLSPATWARLRPARDEWGGGRERLSDPRG